MLRRLLFAGAAILLVAGSSADAAQVWQSTFNSGPDGVVDIFNNNTAKTMIGPASGGTLTITTQDAGTSAFTPDKAGRPLGTTLSGGSSFSGLYNFNWTSLNQAEAQAYELAGFLGNASPQTRQVVGTILRHWKAGPDYYVGLDAAVGGAGFTNFGYSAGPAIWLGTDPFSKSYQLAIGYDGTTHDLSIDLYADGTLLGSKVVDADTIPGLNQFNTPAMELGSLALTHLGWSDYSGNLNDVTTVWRVDSLSYFDTAGGARAAVPEPAASLAVVALAGLAAVRRRR